MQGQRARALWLFCFTSGLLCPGQTAATRTITGVVTDGLTSEPIRRDLVQAFGPGSPMSAFTGADGRFSLEGLPPQSYIQLSVQKPGYSSTQFNATAAGETHISLMPEAKMTGHILDADGQPLEGVTVQVLFSAMNNGRRHWMQQTAVSTDEDGSYSLSSVAAGRYLLRMMPLPALRASSDAAPTVYPARYLPVGSDLSSAEQIDLSAGQELTLETKIHSEPAFRVSGAVVGMPTGMVALLVTDADGQVVSFGTVVRAETGKFTIENVPAGSWAITAQANDPQGNAYFARREVAVTGRDVAGLDVPLQLQASIPIVLKRTASTQAQIRLDPAQPFPATHYFAERLNPQSLETDPQLFVAHVPPGHYRLAVDVVGPDCLSSASSGGVDLLRDELAVSPDSQPEPISVILSNTCATLTGTPESTSSPIVNAVVVAVPKNQQGRTKIAPLATGKTFTLSGLTPGTYEVYAFADVSELNKLEYANPEALREYRGQEIELQGGRQANVTVEVNQARR